MIKYCSAGLLLLMTMALCAGCVLRTRQQPRGQENSIFQGEEIKFILYYSDQELMNLISEERKVTVPADKHIIQAAVEELLRDPSSPGAVRLVPMGAEVLSVAVADGIIALNFNENLRNNFHGGSAGEAMLIKSIVNTVTEISGFETYKVSFLINGKTFDSIGGHISAEELFERRP